MATEDALGKGTPLSDNPLVRPAQEVAAAIKDEEARLEGEREQLRTDMLEVSSAVLEARRSLPGLATVTVLPADSYLRDDRDREQYLRNNQVVLFSEPVRGDDGSITQVAITPAGFRGLRFSGEDDPRFGELNRIIGLGMAGALFAEYQNGYYELHEDLNNPNEKTPNISLCAGRQSIVFKGDELIEVDEETVHKAYENSLNVASNKLRKEENVGGQIEGMQRQREMGKGLMETIRQTTPPPPSGPPR